MRSCVVLFVLVVALLAPSQAGAFNANGHKIVASICYRQLNGTQRAAILSILEKHPRYSEDFKNAMPSSISSDSQEVQDEWLFQQAAVWPDMVKSGPQARRAFNRARWHFVNVPHYLSAADQAALQDHIDVNLETAPANDPDDPKMNVVQAINNSLRIVNGTGFTDAQKAVHICWIFHLIGDIHQPLHSTALFSRNLFPQGDKGGNAVKTSPLSNLHSAWDSALGTSDSFTNCRNAAVTLVNSADFSSAQSSAGAMINPVSWQKESHEIAKAQVYNHEILLQLQALEDADDDIDHHAITLSDDYLRNRNVVGKRQVMLAGLRIAMVFSGVSQAPAATSRVARLNAVPQPQASQDIQSLNSRLEAIESKLDVLIDLLSEQTNPQ